MKKISILLLALLLLPCLVFPTFAHPGSLDANGGHWNRSEGTYHYHEGLHTQGESTSNSSSDSSSSANWNDYYDRYAEGYDDGRDYGYNRGHDDGYKEAVAEYKPKLDAAENNAKGKISWWWLIPLFILFLFLSSKKNRQIDNLIQKNNQLNCNLKSKEQTIFATNRDISVLTDKYNISQHELQKQKGVISDLTKQLSQNESLLTAKGNHVQILKYNLAEKDIALQKAKQNLTLSNQLLEQYKNEFHKQYDLTVKLDRTVTRMERERAELIAKAKYLGAYNYLFDTKSK